MAGALRKTFADMGWSLALVLAVVFVALLIGGHQLLWPGKGDRVQRISYTETVSQAARSVQQPVLAPAGLPHAWKPTSQSLTGHGTAKSPLHLHIGFVTPKQQYAAVEETVPSATVATPRASTVEIAGRRWVIGHAARSRELVLTFVVGRTAVQVTGSAQLAELEALAGSLRQASA